MIRLAVLLIISFTLSIAHTLTFGVLEYKGKEKIIRQYQPLAEHISQQLNRNVELKVLSQEELETLVRQKKIDIVATNPTHFIALRQKGNLTGAIATEIKYYKGMTTSYLGGVIIVRSDNHNIRTLSDLKNRTIAFPGKKFLGGYQTQNYELSKIGIRVPDDVSLIQVKSHESVVESVLSKKAEVGFIRTGIIEEMISDKKLKRSDIYVVHEQKISDFPWIISTSLYPEWAIATQRDLNISLIKQIAAAIYTYVPTNNYEGRIEGFSIPADYIDVDSLARELRLPPYENAPNFTLHDIWQKYGNAIVVLLISFVINMFLLLFLHFSKQKLKKAQIQLVDLAIRDPLTGLYNRRGMNEKLWDLLKILQRNEKKGAIIYLDLDNFKPLNDTHGHVAGDKLLVAVAERLLENVRSIDTVARMGGDEFVILIGDLDFNAQLSEESAIKVAEKIRDALNKLYVISTESGQIIQHNITTSIGLAVFTHHADPDKIISIADRAMYQAKEKGRDLIIVESLE